MPKIKIVRIIARLNIGGPAIHTILLTSGLNNAGFESVLIAGQVEKGEGQMDYLLNRYNVKPIFIPELRRSINFVNDFISFFKIFKLIIKEKPHIVHTHTAKAGFLGRLAAFLLRVPVKVHTFHGHTFHGYFSGYKAKVFLAAERMLAKITDLIISISGLQYRDIVEKYKVAAKSKCKIINLGLDLDGFLAVVRQDAAKENIGFKKSDIIVGTVGRMTDIKNHRLLIDAAKSFYGSYGNDNVKFLIVGDGELKSEIESYRDKLGLKNKIFITGWQEETAKYYSAFDIFVLTSKNEGTPVSMIEAMASGLPCIATNVGGVADVLAEKETGYLIDDFDREKFADRINKLIADKNLKALMGQRGRDRIKNIFDKKFLLKNIEDVYNELLAQKGVK